MVIPVIVRQTGLVWAGLRGEVEDELRPQSRAGRSHSSPVQKPRPPLLIGGGEKLTLRVVARHADQWNTFGSPEVFRHKLEVLRKHCASAGRNFDEIEITWAGTSLITESDVEKEAAVRGVAAMFGAPPEMIEPGLLVGSVEAIRERMQEFIEAGVTHFILLASAPFNHKSIRRFAEEVIPMFRGERDSS